MHTINYNDYYLPAEWNKQTAIQISWPHQHTDWGSDVELFYNIQKFYVNLAETILNYQDLIIVAHDTSLKQYIIDKLNKKYKFKYSIYIAPYNDTWVRDYGPVSLINKHNNTKLILDFNFNAWGGKFDYELDNNLTENIYNQHAYDNNTLYKKINYILEGGAIDSNNDNISNNNSNIILTTGSCVLNSNRNNKLSDGHKIKYLKQYLNTDNIIILNNAKLIGDDTDGHIDILARFCNKDTIVYTACDNHDNPNHDTLLKFKLDLQYKIDDINNKNNLNIKLIPLFIPAETKYSKLDLYHILAQSYVNFLIINNAVLVPRYNNHIYDQKAIDTLKPLFPNRKIIDLDCTTPVEQGGSLHCLTMQICK